MGTDVAAFARQLKEDGIQAAQQDAEKILAEARKKAETLIEESKGEIKKLKQEAETELARNRQKSEADLRLVARDLMQEVRKEVERIGAWLLQDKVKEALSTPDVVKGALTELLKTQKTGQEWELALGPTIGKPLAQAVVNDLFKAEKAKVKLVDGLKKAGFELASGSGTEVLEVTDDSVTDAFRRLLSPALAKILSEAVSDA